MSLATGFRRGPYEIVAPLGAGCIGEVYRARDSRLNRHVALKILPEVFARDDERMARFPYDTAPDGQRLWVLTTGDEAAEPDVGNELDKSSR